jgi:hypothetical protein
MADNPALMTTAMTDRGSDTGVILHRQSAIAATAAARISSYHERVLLRPLRLAAPCPHFAHSYRCDTSQVSDGSDTAPVIGGWLAECPVDSLLIRL